VLGAYIVIGNVAAATDHKEDRLFKLASRRVVCEQPRANHANGLHVAIPDIIHSLNSATGEASGHDLGCIDIGIVSSTSGLGNPVDSGGHSVLIGRAAASRRALSDGEEAMAGDVLKQGGVGCALVAAAAVAPHQDWQLFGPGILRIEDCVAGNRSVGFVCGWTEGS